MAAAPIAELDHDQLRAVEQAFHDLPNNLFGQVRRWDLALVLLGECPACRLISIRDLVSSRGMAELRNRPEEFARGDFLGQLLRECGLPYSIRFPHQRSADSSTLYTTYYVASTPERFELLPNPYCASPDERTETWMNCPRKLGQFLGSPADAIEVALVPASGFAVDDSVIDFVIDDIRDLLTIVGVDAPQFRYPICFRTCACSTSLLTLQSLDPSGRRLESLNVSPERLHEVRVGSTSGRVPRSVS